MSHAGRSVSRRAFVLGVMGVAAGAVAGASGCAGAAADPAWSVEKDDDLPILCMEVAGGAVVASPADGWAKMDGFVQLQLGGGSIPGASIKSATTEDSGSAVRVTLDSTGVFTQDLVWTEWRLTPPAGVDLAGVGEVRVDYGDGNPVTLEELLPNDSADSAADAAPADARPVV